MNPSLQECCRICMMAEGYCELGLFEEAFKLVESLPPELKQGARSTLLRLKARPEPQAARALLGFA